MTADPILVLQMHRMGDLILTFPLLMRLRQMWPQNPVWVVAEPAFFEQLMPLAPDAVFFPSSHCGALAQRSYAAAINLSSSPVAAQTMAALDSPLKLGPVADGAGLRVQGFWQLYRAASLFMHSTIAAVGRIFESDTCSQNKAPHRFGRWPNVGFKNPTYADGAAKRLLFCKVVF